MPRETFKAAAAQASVFSCRVDAARDGDSFYCVDGTPVQLDGIEAPEPGNCGPADGCGEDAVRASRLALQQMIEGRTVRCRRRGMSYSRINASCRVDGVDLSCALHRAGHVAPSPRFGREGLLCAP